jgi:hypothetical protein
MPRDVAPGNTMTMATDVATDTTTPTTTARSQRDVGTAGDRVAGTGDGEAHGTGDDEAGEAVDGWAVALRAVPQFPQNGRPFAAVPQFGQKRTVLVGSVIRSTPSLSGGAEAGIRTRTRLPSAVFETAASAIPPLRPGSPS